MLRILALEPFHGGSHQAFLEQWLRHSRHEVTLLTLPATSWKWRMRQGAIELARRADTLCREGREFDLLFASDMLNLAEFLGLASPALRNLPSVLYFHENQITYPFRDERERDYHFGLTNVTSALAADSVWFNSAYHQEDFLAATEDFLSRMPAPRLSEVVPSIRDKACVQSPGVEPRLFEVRGRVSSDEPLRVLWAARWEHDKDPETFFAAIERVIEGTPLRMAVVGQSFRFEPEIFATMRRRLSHSIESWGYQASRSEYESLLSWADVIVSTARHEFFGLSIVEGMAAGAWPVLPTRLSYPELLSTEPELETYGDGIEDLVAALREADLRKAGRRLDRAKVRRAAGRFSWSVRAPAMDQSLVRIVGEHAAAATAAKR